jgi:hypothetical protein
MPMTDAELGKLVNAAFDEGGFVETIRERLRDAVTGVISAGAAEGEVHAARVAAEDLASLLVARHAEPRARRPRPPGVTSGDDAKRRATAFRVMAGVRV